MADDKPKNYVKIYEAYRDEAIADRDGLKFCKWVRLAAERDARDHQKAYDDPDTEFYFDEWRANDVCGFIEKLPHIEGVWETPTLILEPWQIFILCACFGWRRRAGMPDSDLNPRKFNTVYIELARKNGKSALTSGIALYCLCCEGENGPQVKTAAKTGNQARIVFDIAKKMVEKTPALQDYFDVVPMANSVVCHDNSGSIQPINAKASNQDGLNPHCTIIDELHAHDNRSLFDVLKSARGARKNPMSWYITTAGYNIIGVCYEQRTFVTKVLQQVWEADHYFGIIYTLDGHDSADKDSKKAKKDDPFDPTVWIKANPNLGVSVQVKELEGYAKEAKASPASEGEFKTKRCNLWLNAFGAWLNMAQWDACCDASLKMADFKGCDCWIGVDLSERRDITGIVALFRDGEHYYAFPRFYMPEEMVEEKAQTVYTHYKTWAKNDWLVLTPGDYIDVDYIEKDIKETAIEYGAEEIIFDQRDNPTLFNHLGEEGLEVSQLLKNAANYTQPAKELEALIEAKRFHHNGNPCLKWMASNCVADKRIDGSLLPKKENKDSENKIDGIDCIIVGLARAIVDDDGGGYMDEVYCDLEEMEE